ncbi:hypothetical protein PF005_g3718 [Phytophthora fragariae]|uniref:Uncharacterized protein n=1 Tax=Phytophthora fragariae TaxID=53985 RepID=A0A6A3FQ84_9STRA|nr:hypothetical protein PF003_g35091 [Phytophthora fragariae]KAE8947173.1 hypothetical protein PF009_g3214 [Phytophthora fragariae]KAE9025863.1 hypothetical protein PF011_g2832 [Phytophthora fragariae]KAE9132602.1 hypothetical protein PF007_g3652 [Phytophthora fragariae]KAE9133212.1 hypothetical protein PF010_g2891 [Phytophthora fragariae]
MGMSGAEQGAHGGPGQQPGGEKEQEQTVEEQRGPEPPTEAEQANMSEVQTEEMFAAVVAAMKAGKRERSPRDNWITTIVELYAIAHDKVAIDEDRVPGRKTKYPQTTWG